MSRFRRNRPVGTPTSPALSPSSGYRGLRNALQASDEDPGGMRPLVRTKLLVLAWAHDETYDEGYLRRIDREPERFGDFELAQ